jgi:hypothetical protein
MTVTMQRHCHHPWFPPAVMPPMHNHRRLSMEWIMQDIDNTDVALRTLHSLPGSAQTVIGADPPITLSLHRCNRNTKALQRRPLTKVGG